MSTTPDLHEPDTHPVDPAPATAPAPADDGPGVVKRTTKTASRVALVVVGVLVGLFAAVNTRDVEVSWVFGDPLQTPLILVIGLALLAGLIIGWLAATLRHRGS